MRALVEALRAAFRADVVAPERAVHELGPGASLLVMPAWRDRGSFGVKLVDVDTARTPAVRACYVLSDAAGVRALFDGAMLTARRTAAASALAADCLARPDARRLLMIGTGTLAPHLVEAHAAVRGIEEIGIWGRTPARAEELAAALTARGYAASTVASLPDAVASADIISIATTSTTALVHGADLSPGTHVDLVGAFRPDMCEADPEAFRRARVFVDTRAGALAEAGDLLQAIASGAITAGDIVADLADLCRSGVAARDDAGTITLFKSVGTAIEDLACAEFVLARGDSA